MITPEHCPRLWEVEAARNAQLLGTPLHAHFEHLAGGCRACNEQAQYLARIRACLLALDPAHDEVALRRVRRATLERASARRSKQAHQASRARNTWLLCVACLVFTAASHWLEAYVWSLWREPAPVAVVTPLGLPQLRHGMGSEWKPAPLSAREDVAITASTSAGDKHLASPAPAASAHRVLLRMPRKPAGAAPPVDPNIVTADASGVSDEDSVYLTLIHLVRERRQLAARLMAADYLTRFPEGLHSVEVERVLRSRELASSK